MKTIKELAQAYFDSGLDLKSAEELFKVSIFREAERRSRGNRTMAAELLGVHRNTVTRVLGRDKP